VSPSLLQIQDPNPEKSPATNGTSSTNGEQRSGGFTTLTQLNAQFTKTVVQPMKENEKLRAVILKNKLELNYKGKEK
jgi:hypothetical protein